MAQLYRNLGDSLHLLMEGFHEVEACVYATPKEKEAIKAGIDAIMTIECHMNRSKMMPYAHTDFSQGIETIKEIANEMNFPNQSFLGKYFKEHVGVTPSEYRKS